MEMEDDKLDFCTMKMSNYLIRVYSVVSAKKVRLLIRQCFFVT